MIDRLIATPSVSSASEDLDLPNLPVCELLAEWMEAAGFEVRIEAVPGHPGKANVIGVLGAGPGGLVLSGHTDTVPYDDGLWTSDPFKATERDGRLYGLGTTDMKSFLAIALAVASEYAKRDLAEPLILLGTADEETGMAGARAIAEAGAPFGRFALIGEPTDLKPVRAHKGVLMESLHLVGRSGHSSNPALGNSALDGMADAIDELRRLRGELAAAHRDEDYTVPGPTLNLGSIRGGDNANRICGSCELQFDMRLVPGMTAAASRRLVRERVRQRLADSGLGIHFHSLFDGIDPLQTRADSPLVRAAETLTGHAAGAVDFGTEGPYFQELGMDALVLGPGSIDVAHQPDEYLPLDAVEPAQRLLHALIQRFCVAPAQAG